MLRLTMLISALLLSTQADATVVTRDFILTSSKFANFFNESSPFSSLTASFRVTYDDTISGYVGSPDIFAVKTDGKINTGPFSAQSAFGYFHSNWFTPYPRLVLGGALNGTNRLVNGTNDFFISFDASASSAVLAQLSFTTADNRAPFQSEDAEVSQVVPSTDVPEPFVWAMMTIGFGVGGLMLRRRRVALMALSRDHKFPTVGSSTLRGLRGQSSKDTILVPGFREHNL